MPETNEWKISKDSVGGVAHIWVDHPDEPEWARSLCGRGKPTRGDNLQGLDQGINRCIRCQKAHASMTTKYQAVQRVLAGESEVDVARTLGVTRAAVSVWVTNAGVKPVGGRRPQVEYATLLDFHLNRSREEYEIFIDDTNRTWLKVPDGDTLGGHLATVVKAASVTDWQVVRWSSQNITLVPTYAYCHIVVACLANLSKVSIGAKALGSVSTPKKAAAARQNAKKGGWPLGRKRKGLDPKPGGQLGARFAKGVVP